MPILTISGLLGVGLAILAVIAQVATPQAPEAPQIAAQKAGRGAGPDHPEHRITPSTDPQEVLEYAILTLETRHSVSAKIRHRVDLFDQRPAGSGVYLEQRSERGLLLRFEARTQLAGEPSSLLQVCDGRYLWIYEKLGDDESLSHIDVARVENKLEESGKLEDIANIGWWPGLGGLTRLLRAIDAAFEFHSIEEGQLVGQAGPLPVWKLQGEWEPDRLAKWLPGRKSAKRVRPRDLSKLPGHLPDHVILYLGKTDLFPYRIEYCRRAPDPQPSQAGSEDHAVVTIELFEVDLNASIHPAHFLYHPGDLECLDRTGPFLKSLGLAP